MHTPTHTQAHTHTHIHIHAHTCTHPHTRRHTRTHTYTYTHIHIHAHTHTHTHSPTSVEILRPNDRPVTQTSTGQLIIFTKADSYATRGIRTRNPSQQAAADLSDEQRSHGVAA